MNQGALYNVLKKIKPLVAVVQGVRKLHSRFRLDSWILTGEERVSGEPITVFFSGQIENCNYIARIVFREGCYKTRSCKMWSWKVSKLINNVSVPYSLIFLQTNQVTHNSTLRNYSFLIPSWIAGELDVAHALQCQRGNDSVKTDLRNIRRNRFTFRVTRKPEEMEKFYYTMYLPYVRQTHGDHAFIATLDELRREANKRSELLLVEQDGKPVAGVYLGIHDHERIDALELGVMGANRDLVKMGALAAIYYYSLLHASEGKYKRLFLGGARPFLNDGPLRYKKKWGLHITGRLHTLPDQFVFRPCLGSTAVDSFLENNPFVYEEKNAFRVAVFIGAQQEYSDQLIDHIRKAYCLPGFAGATVFRIDAGAMLALEGNIAPLTPPDVTLKDAPAA